MAVSQALSTKAAKLRARSEWKRHWLRILQMVIFPIVAIFLIFALGDFIKAWHSADALDWGVFWSSVWLGPKLGVPLFTITILLMRDPTTAVEKAASAQPPKQTELAELADHSLALAVAAPDGASRQLSSGRLTMEFALLMLQMPSLALVGDGWGAQHLQQRYLDGLPRRCAPSVHSMQIRLLSPTATGRINSQARRMATRPSLREWRLPSARR
jgi:hypothetical protein